ncbi:hypothetical protein [Microbacterium panaciterrae]|uniref:DUF4282 domain-containing protein n=1 Tax=Microbacterium panaciterrae TaxID=985759 RepID=A0ABP8PTV0_9MICO
MFNRYADHVAYLFEPRSWARHIGVLVYSVILWAVLAAIFAVLFFGVDLAGKDLWAATAPEAAFGAKGIVALLYTGLFLAFVVTAFLGALEVIIWAIASTLRIRRVRTRVLRWVAKFQIRSARAYERSTAS